MLNPIRNQDILQGGKFRQEIMKLKNKTNRGITVISQLVRFKPADIFSIDQHLTGSCLIQCPDNIQQSTLAAAGLTDYGIETPGIYL
ncbi:hypothetical protein SDC9_134575 [bioreactor metagenome]|uniref:Uncharacterized protein n=1 Tax=bioreactor metagenome TaxID=1076179 RepID=A0A645DDZ9_9ZZZZ